LAGLLAAALLPQAVQAESAFTLRCKGTRSWVAGAGGATASERVINYYTFLPTAADGWVYGWHEHAWNALQDDDPKAWHLEQQRQGMTWWLSIGRGEGAWSEAWEVQGRAISITGSCTKVALRQPPNPPPVQ
jgi:hypothetical protein